MAGQIVQRVTEVLILSPVFNIDLKETILKFLILLQHLHFI